MKRTCNTNYFYKFFVTENRNDDITAIKIIGTALNKPKLPYIIFAKSTWTVIQPLILFLKIDNVFTSLSESGTRSHIFGAKDERLSLL